MVLKVNRVAVIGAGVSGLATARHLKEAGLEVVIYERSSTSGGVWSYDERQPPEPTYPSIRPSIGDFILDEENASLSNGKAADGENGKSHVTPQEIEEIELLHAPPGPAYYSLTNNISTVLQELKGHPWKEGTDDFVNVRVIGDYLQGFSRTFNLEPTIQFNTRVEKLDKLDTKWRLQSSTLVRDGPGRGSKVQQTEEFDAVVVASGHYHASRVPDTPGLKEWKATWPDRVSHSKRYRHPQSFKDQTVLLIGAGVSSTDIAREITHYAKKIYQSARGSDWDLPLAFLPAKTTRVAEIASYEPTSSNSSISSGTITLTDGTTLTGIDRILICTGYHISYPFLSNLHSDFITPGEADETVLVTDGTMLHNLHKDIFYIPDPTLAFVGAPYYVATFTLFEFQGIAISSVFAGSAWLPPQPEMRDEYRERVERKGLGRNLHSLKGKEVEYVDEIVTWLNAHALTTGARRVEGHSERWLEEDKLKFLKIRKMFEDKETGMKLSAGDKEFKGAWSEMEKRTENLVSA